MAGVLLSNWNAAWAGGVGWHVLRLLAVGGLVASAVLGVRARVWSDGAGMHVRKARTRTVRWEDVVDVSLNEGLFADSVRLRTREGRAVRLPVGLGHDQLVARWRAATEQGPVSSPGTGS